jgi:hypothetical protein
MNLLEVVPLEVSSVQIFNEETSNGTTSNEILFFRRAMGFTAATGGAID